MSLRRNSRTKQNKNSLHWLSHSTLYVHQDNCEYKANVDAKIQKYSDFHVQPSYIPLIFHVLVILHVSLTVCSILMLHPSNTFTVAILVTSIFTKAIQVASYIRIFLNQLYFKCSNNFKITELKFYFNQINFLYRFFYYKRRKLTWFRRKNINSRKSND